MIITVIYIRTFVLCNISKILCGVTLLPAYKCSIPELLGLSLREIIISIMLDWDRLEGFTCLNIYSVFFNVFTNNVLNYYKVLIMIWLSCEFRFLTKTFFIFNIIKVLYKMTWVFTFIIFSDVNLSNFDI